MSKTVIELTEMTVVKGSYGQQTVLNKGTVLVQDMDNFVVSSAGPMQNSKITPIGQMKFKVLAEKEEVEKKEFKLDPAKQYRGKEAIDYIVLFLQNKKDLSDIIARDDAGNLFADLGGVEMWPDYTNSSWIMELNARIPIKSAASVGKRIVKGKARLAVVFHDNFV